MRNPLCIRVLLLANLSWRSVAWCPDIEKGDKHYPVPGGQGIDTCEGPADESDPLGRQGRLWHDACYSDGNCTLWESHYCCSSVRAIVIEDYHALDDTGHTICTECCTGESTGILDGEAMGACLCWENCFLYYDPCLNSCESWELCGGGTIGTTFTCTLCPEGSAINVAGNACVDLNECQALTCGENADCTDNGETPGVTCECISDGYEGDPPDVPCVDVDECTAWPGPLCGADEICVNTPGDFNCEPCDDGTAPDIAGTACEDDDDCSEGGVCRLHSCEDDETIVIADDGTNPCRRSDEICCAAKVSCSVLTPDTLVYGSQTFFDIGKCDVQEKCLDEGRTCVWYTDCLEEIYDCGANEYPRQYGEKICSGLSVSGVGNGFSSDGKDWLREVHQCILDTWTFPINVDGDASSICDGVESEGFVRTVDCFVDKGFCDLEAGDLVALAGLIRDELLWKYATRSLLAESLYQCEQFRGFRYIKGAFRWIGGLLSKKKVCDPDPLAPLDCDVCICNPDGLGSRGSILEQLTDSSVRLASLNSKSVIVTDIYSGSIVVELLIFDDTQNGLLAEDIANELTAAWSETGESVGDLNHLTFIGASSCLVEECGFTRPSDGDDDNDGVRKDLCPATDLPESVPTGPKGLGKNRWVVDSTVFPLVFKTGSDTSEPLFTVESTFGCSCEQIIAHCGYGKSHEKFGCSTGVLERWSSVPYYSGLALELRCRNSGHKKDEKQEKGN